MSTSRTDPRLLIISQSQAAKHTSTLLGNTVLTIGGMLMVTAILSAAHLLLPWSLPGFFAAGLSGLVFMGLGVYIKSLGRLAGTLAEAMALQTPPATLAEVGIRHVPDAARIARAVNEVTTALELPEEE